MTEAAFTLTRCVEINVDVRVENLASRRVLEKAGFVFVSSGLQGAPARGGLEPCDRLQLRRDAWGERRAASVNRAKLLSETTQ
jgi:RimJ/RimL family protein N-acetyltransferase